MPWFRRCWSPSAGRPATDDGPAPPLGAFDLLCPYIPGKRYIDWDLQDPKDQPIERIRQTLDDIAHRIDQLVTKLDSPMSQRMG